jgi:hypothetical protein
VAYRINSLNGTAAINKLERLGKGLVWNAVSLTDTPVVFLPLTISATWPYATNATADPSSPSAYETIGPQIFRFEYYYLLKTDLLNTVSFSVIPWNGSPGHTNVSGMQDVAAMVVNIAVIDPKSKVLLSDTTTPPQIAQVASQLIDWGTTGCVGCPSSTQWQTTPGLLRTQWQNKLNGITNLPRPAISGIRLYERYFYLSQ